MVDLEVIGRHALLFDDDAMAAFVDSPDALIDWNSLRIDRYDVRHLLSDPPPPRRRRSVPHLEPDGVSRSDLDRERFRDLPLEEFDDNTPSETSRQEASASLQAVGFSYENTNASSEQNNADSGSACSGFRPPFPVPETLLKNLPPTEKIHQIIARTAKFVSEHGGQSEIVLRVKQGDNPTFGFLMPDHNLHPYFRFLVDHQELLKTETDVKPTKEEKKADSGRDQAHAADGALSLLGSVYGSAEDDDYTLPTAVESQKKGLKNSVDPGNKTAAHVTDQAKSSVYLAEAAVKQSSAAAVDEKVSSSRRGSSLPPLSSLSTQGKKRETETSSSHGGSLSFTGDERKFTSHLSTSVVDHLVIEPPPYMRKAVEKIVEFIQRNGKEFEAVLIDQDKPHGKFPFLLPSNPYYPFYLKSLQSTQESKSPSRNVASTKFDSLRNIANKDRAKDIGGSKRDGKVMSKDFANHGLKMTSELKGSFDSERKEKFRMVIGGSKKDTQDSLSKPAQQECGMSAEEAAAVVLAATRGHRNVRAGSLLKPSSNDTGAGLSGGDGGRTSSNSSFSFSYHAHSSVSKPLSDGELSHLKSADMPVSVHQSDKGGKSSDVSVATAIAKTVALVAASEADSSEASLTKEQKLKAERLKRAKMFAAMIKGGGLQSGEAITNLLESSDKAPSRAGSVPAASASNLSASDLGDPVSREREGSSVPADKADRKTCSDDDDKDKERERRSRKKHRSRSRRHDDDSDAEYKHSRKKHRSERSSHRDKDEHRHRKHHSSHEDREQRHRRKHRHHSSSDDEHEERHGSDKRRRSYIEKELEEGEISDTASDHIDSKEVKSKAATAANDGREGSIQSGTDNRSSDATEIPDDLRAKVRAMLLATM